MNTETASDIIEAKGVAAIADAADASRELVRQWKHRRKFPRSVWAHLIHAFPDLTFDRLRIAEARVKSPALFEKAE